MFYRIFLMAMALAANLWVPAALANDLTITNVSLGARDPGTKTVVVKFDIAWENSWRNKINHDAVWLTLRLHSADGALLSHKKLCSVSAVGLNPVGSLTGSGTPVEFFAPADKKGVFVRRSVNGKVANASVTGAQLTIDYDSCGFTDSDEVYVSIFGLEMVFVPQGSYYAGDNSASVASLNRGSADISAWPVTSESGISVSNPASGGYRYVSNSNPNESATGSAFTIPAAYPKGYQAFYVMKYEVNEGQWVEFVNSLGSDEARMGRDLTDNGHKSSDSVVARSTIACSGSPLVCSTTRPSRAVSYLTWMDLAAFLDWVALRPMSELEYEKMARGPQLPVEGEYVWGTTDIQAAANLNGTEDGTETVSTTDANAHYGNMTLTGGDSSNGVEHQTGALRNGIFATTGSSRATAGAGYYGVLDLAGNLKERVVTLGNANGLAYSGNHGDGVLTAEPGFEGNADVTTWPGMDAMTERGVTGAAGSGFRGGSWADAAGLLRVSDRSEAALAISTAANTFGGRGVRTYDGN